METDITAHLTTGAVVVYVIEYLKRSQWFKWLSADSATTNRIVSGLAAAAMAFGISATGSADTGWVIHVPSLAVLMVGIWEWAKQYVLQQVLYDSVVQKAGKTA